jgi:ribosomal protein S18 acetylase RimI-like enzyme
MRSASSIRPVGLQRVPIEGGAEALRLAAQAWPRDEQAGQLATILDQVRGGLGDSLVLVEARQGDRLVGASLAQCLPGRAAVVWLPQIEAGEDPETTHALLAAVHAHLHSAGVQLAQSLLEPNDDAAKAHFIAAGYVHAGDLRYLAASAECFPRTPPAHALDFVPAPLDRPERLAALVTQTYRGSLDCPLVDGMRDSEDILAGYRAVGAFRPELWLIVQAGGSDVGCLLIADHPAENQLEIVYTGLVPAVRGRGWGRLVTLQALWLASKCGRARVVLAVDAANWPALAMYEAAGFTAWDRRTVLVRTFRDAASTVAATT